MSLRPVSPSLPPSRRTDSELVHSHGAQRAKESKGDRGIGSVQHETDVKSAEDKIYIRVL